jgi:hypothetical protein
MEGNMGKFDVAAYVWPSYHRDERALQFWPAGIGEWETVLKNKAKFEGHQQPRFPLWGPVNEADPYVMRMQIDAAADHGVNVFIYDWYWYDRRPFLEGCLNDGYLKANNNDRVKFYLMWANHDASTLWDIRLSDQGDRTVWLGSVDRLEFEKICRRLISMYFTHPSYYRIDGKPVFMIYDLDSLIRGLGGSAQAREALDWFREQAVLAGLGGLHLQCTLRKHMGYLVTGPAGETVGSQQDVVEALGFDSLTHYQFCHFADIDRDYKEIMKDVAREWDVVAQDYHVPYFPHVSIGWDNNPRFLKFRPGIVKGNDPGQFEKALLMAREYLANHPGQPQLVTINSWNEWTETSYLEPDDLYGYGYLDAVKAIFPPTGKE